LSDFSERGRNRGADAAEAESSRCLPRRARCPQHHRSPSSMESVGGQSNGDLFWHANLTLDQLPAALYRTNEMPNIGFFAWNGSRADADDLMELPDSPSGAVLEEIRRFWGTGTTIRPRAASSTSAACCCGDRREAARTATLQQLIAIVGQ